MRYAHKGRKVEVNVVNAIKRYDRPNIAVWPNDDHDARRVYPKPGVRTTAMDSRDILVIHKNPKCDGYSDSHDRMAKHGVL